MKFNISIFLISLVLGTLANLVDETKLSPANNAPLAHVPHSGHCSEEEFRLSEDGLCYSKVFVPTNEFQKIVEGRSIPKGLHVQMNFETGVKMAKIFEGNSNHGAIVTVPIDHSNPENNRQTKFSAIDPLLHVPLETLSDKQKVVRFLKQISIGSSSEKEIDSALVELKEIVDDLEIGQSIFVDENFSALTNLLKETDIPEHRLQVARVLGTALQNNSGAQKAAHKWDIVAKLLFAIEKETSIKSLDRLLFALSASVRGNHLALEAFYRSNGDRILLEVYSSAKDESVKRRILNLITEVSDPSLQPEFPEGADEELSLIKKLDPSLKITVPKWCTTLKDNSIDALSELASEALEGLTKTFPDYCPA